MSEMSNVQRPARYSQRSFAWVFDERVLQVLAQLVFVAFVLAGGYLLYKNLEAELAKQGTRLGFGYLNQTSGFDISIKFLPHTRADSNLNAIRIAILNTIAASLMAITLSTVLGVLIGIMSVSRYFLVNRIARLYIEIFRNIPLLLVIIASFAVFVYNLPNVNDSIVLPGPSYLSNRGLYTPRLVTTPQTTTYLVILAIGTACVIMVTRFIVKRRQLDSLIGSLVALATILGLGVVVWWILPEAPFALEIPEKTGLNYTGGLSFPPEFVGIVMGLVLGSSPFIADTVRAGLQSVGKGQIEAAHALGMRGYQVMRLIVLPQAMRVIVPPMTSNYLSLIKNSSLASAIAFPEIVHVSSTITSQTGRAVETMLIMMAIYATLSLITSLIMNWYNNRMRIVER